jgi:mono/diheme cytochrome c family protein
MRAIPSFAALIAALFLLGACTGPVRDFFRGYAEGRASALADYDAQTLTPSQRGAVAFALSDFGALNTDALETHAVPWRVVAAALVMRDVRLHGGVLSTARIQPIMTRFGFLYPSSVANWPAGLAPPPPQLDTPQGMSLGVVQRGVPRIELTTANLACASCHAGHEFDEHGAPRPDISWLGTPNTSLNLELYVQEVYAAIKELTGREDELLAAIPLLFPETSDAELSTIRAFVMPRLQARMGELADTGDRPLPFVNGAPGITNGVAALRMQFGQLDDDSFETARGFTSIPDLSARGFRTALLYDAAYAPPGDASPRIMTPADITPEHLNQLADVTAFFTVPSMGVRPNHVRAHMGEARDVLTFLSTYAPQRFPGPIDADLATRGRDIYAARCASCHGVYDDDVQTPRLQSFPNWIGPFDTDPARTSIFTPPAVDAVNRSAYGDHIVARATGQYAAPILAGLWMSAPYLHNGSVPTLWHLMHPNQRPARFQVGGHRLDYARLGIDGTLNSEGDYVYPAGYQPWSTPSMIDARGVGFGNQGHVAPFDAMSEAEKRALLEYLKRI